MSSKTKNVVRSRHKAASLFIFVVIIYFINQYYAEVFNFTDQVFTGVSRSLSTLGLSQKKPRQFKEISPIKKFKPLERFIIPDYSAPQLSNDEQPVVDETKPTTWSWLFKTRRDQTRQHSKRTMPLIRTGLKNTEKIEIPEKTSVADVNHDPRRSQCFSQFGKKGFLEPEQKRLPPMLYTFPGSGNTWSRLLIEHATGIYTGSVYNDKTLLKALPGEFTCNRQVSAIKVHPHTHDFESLFNGRFHSDAKKCNKGNVNRFERAIMLIRNPFDSIWSEFQRRVSQSHVQGVSLADFDWLRWQANAAALSHSYFELWTRHHAGIEQKFRPKDYLFVKYEDLKSKTKRIVALRKITNFLNIQMDKITDERLECAFVLSENRQALRATNPNKTMTKDVAYTQPLVCRMWALFGPHAARHGYHIWNNFTCPEDTPAIPRVNVGPRGEYNMKFSKKNSRLIDFGGYDRSIGKSRPHWGETSDTRVKPSGLRKQGNLRNPFKKPPVPTIADHIISSKDEDTGLVATKLLGDSGTFVESSNRGSGRKGVKKMGLLPGEVGMTLEQASAVGGNIKSSGSSVGAEKPAWQ